MKKKLTEDILLHKTHYPVIAFFNAIPEKDFVRIVEQMSLGIGTGINVVDCTFPNDLDDNEEKFEGVMFSLHDEEIILEYHEFFHYIKLACELYTAVYPESENILERYLVKIAKNYGI